MLRLRRCQLSGIGNRSARFSPVGLDFTSDAEADHTAIFLENGGGKTTLGAFLYLTLCPEQRDFLLKKAKDSQARVANYLLPGQTACIALECEVRASGLFDTPVRRVIGQVFLRKETSDKAKVERRFFTFLPAGDLSFDDLPLPGLAGGSVQCSYDEFTKWLASAKERCPGAELWHSEAVEEWVKRLRDIHAEPDLVKVQVELNQREGGIDDHFKEHCADSRHFVHTLLDLALQHPRGEETAKLLTGFLAEWQRIGYLEDETAFCQEFATALDTLAERQERWHAADRELHAVKRKAARWWVSLSNRAAALESERKSAEEDLRQTKLRAGAVENELKNARNHAISYELEYLEWCAKDAAAAVRDATESFRACDREARVAELAIRAGEIERAERELRALREVLAQRTDDLTPVLQELHCLGFAYATKLESSLVELSEQERVAKNDLRDAKSALDEAETKARDLAVEKDKLERELADLATFFEKRDYQRKQLGLRERLAPKERVEDGRERWRARHAALEAAIVDAAHEEDAAQTRLNALHGESTEASAARAKGDAAAQSLAAQVSEAAGRLREIVEHPLVEAHFGPIFEPLRHGAEEEVVAKQGSSLRELLNAQLDRAALERSEQGIAEYRVLPPSREVESVLQALRLAGLHAEPGLKYLAETCSAAEAQALIRAEPARYAGVLVAPDSWERVPSVAMPELSHPVAVSSFPETLTADDAGGIYVVLPVPAAFDTAAAAQQSLRLEPDLRRVREQCDDRQRELGQWGELLSRLHSYRGDFGEGKLEALKRIAEARAREAEALGRRCEELRAAMEEQKTRLATAKDAEAQARREQRETVSPAIRELDDFWNNFESIGEEKRRAEVKATEDLRANAEAQGKLGDQRALAEGERERAQMLVFSLSAEAREQRDELGTIHFRDGEEDAALAALSLGEVRERYHQQRSLYEGRQDLEAQVELKTKESLLESRKRELGAQLRGLSEAEIHSRAEVMDFDEGRLRRAAELAANAREQARDARSRWEAEQQKAQEDFGRFLRQAPEGGKRRFPEGETRPASREESRTLLERGQRIRGEKEAAKATADSEVSAAQERVGDLKTAEADFRAEANRLETYQVSDIDPAELPPDLTLIRTEVKAILEAARLAIAEEGRLRGLRDEKLRAARDVTVDERFVEKKVSLAKRFELYTDDKMLADLELIRRDLDQRIASNLDRLDGLRKTKSDLVQMMDGLADDVLRLLRDIEKVSRLPDEGMGAWSGKSFIKLAMHQPDEAERRVRLQQLLEELIELRLGPKPSQPDTDAAALVRRIADKLVCDHRLRVQILKPTPARLDIYEDVEMLRHYSGGEGVTVAILMYLTIVQLRAQVLHSSRRLQDAGFLLLDNPFGKCNRADLVEMQVQLARQLRVQLIVMTGLTDPVILMSYPRRVRLVNDMVNRVTGARHVRVEDSEAHISAVQNLRRFRFETA